MYIDKKYLILGIRGAKGATLPRLCFAQLAFALCVKCYFVVKCIKLWTHTQSHGHTITYISRWSTKTQKLKDLLQNGLGDCVAFMWVDNTSIYIF